MVKERGFQVPQLEHYVGWVNDDGSLLSNAGLEEAVSAATSEEAKRELQLGLTWSRRVNELVTEIVKGIPPFPYVRRSLEKIVPVSDVIVVSATPCEALLREWEEHDIAKYAKIIAGQEMGSKKEHLGLAANKKYQEHHVLMVGDAPGDLKAAKANNALFYPINPGAESKSWKRFHDEAFDKFISGEYQGEYEEKLIAEFNAYLPEVPPWQK
ncbi:MAG: HAD family hydrolase [Planctomycetota bacterium]|jgi:phosphoglycolate phosphatase-like HAD superfamily hydrolase